VYEREEWRESEQEKREERRREREKNGRREHKRKQARFLSDSHKIFSMKISDIVPIASGSEKK
jgi:hypothetical protein